MSSANAFASGAFGLDGRRHIVDMRHLQLAVLDREGELALDQIERILAEHLEAPALQHRQILRTTPAASVPSRRLRASRRGATSISRLRILSSSLSRSATSAPSLPSGAPRGIFSGISLGQRLGFGEHLHQPLADVVVLPPG
jgi:hypothetical protein